MHVGTNVLSRSLVWLCPRQITAIQIAVVTLLLNASVLSANELQPTIEEFLEPTPAPRKALVIGVSDYEFLRPIPSVARDMILMSEKLEELGFTVTESFNESAPAIRRKVRDFASSIVEGDIAVVYFSGHGFQWRGLNFLATSETPKSMELEDLQFVSIPLKEVPDRLKRRGAAISLLIVDACRANNLNINDENVEKGIERQGMAAEQSVARFVIGFAAGFGQLAQGSPDPNHPSTYTKHLYTLLGQEGKHIIDTLVDVSAKVEAENNGQTPEIIHRAAGYFYPKPDDSSRRLEKTAWSEVLSSQDVTQIRTFLLKWPANDYAIQARRYLKTLSPASELLAAFVEMSRRIQRGSPSNLDSSWPPENMLASSQRERIFRSPASLPITELNPLPENTHIADRNIAFSPPYDGFTVTAGQVLERYGYRLPIYATPNSDEDPIAFINADDRLLLLDYGTPTDPSEDTSGNAWARLMISPDTISEKIGYVPEAFQFREKSNKKVRLLLRDFDPLNNKALSIDVTHIHREWWIDSKLAANTSLRSVVEGTSSESEKIFGEGGPSHAFAVIDVTSAADNSTNRSEAEQLAFIRSLMIRRQLVNAGIRPENIQTNNQQPNDETTDSVTFYQQYN